MLFVKDRMNSPEHDDLSRTVCLVNKLLKVYNGLKVPCTSSLVLFFFLLDSMMMHLVEVPFFPLFLPGRLGLLCDEFRIIEVLL